MPALKMLRWSTGSPWACSGLVGGLPPPGRASLAAWGGAAVDSRAIPKSIFTSPVRVTNTLGEVARTAIFSGCDAAVAADLADLGDDVPRLGAYPACCSMPTLAVAPMETTASSSFNSSESATATSVSGEELIRLADVAISHGPCPGRIRR